MKLTLEELRVDGSMVQPTEAELAEVKGGDLFLLLTAVGLGIAAATLAVTAYSAFRNSNGTAGSGTSSTSGSGVLINIEGNVFGVVNTNGNGTSYTIQPDSVYIYYPDGTKEVRYY